MRTFNDWNDPPLGFFEMDMVAHCGKSVAGSHVHSLVLTDIASGWTEVVALVVREQTLITVKVDEVRARLPFAVLGLDVDNDSAFIKETLVEFCKDRQIELTRSRAYKKNDQAWVEQKNGSVVPRLVGYGRLEGERSASVLDELHQVARFYVNLFLPCFKLKSKTRHGAKVSKRFRDSRRLLAGLAIGALVISATHCVGRQPAQRKTERRHTRLPAQTPPNTLKPSYSVEGEPDFIFANAAPGD